MRILIYGGSGYLGSSFINLIKTKNEVIAITRKNIKTKKKSNPFFLNQFNDKRKILKEIKLADLIIFSNGPSFKNSKKELFSYVSFFENEIDLIKSNKKKKTKIVYFSTIHIYRNYSSKKSNYSSLNKSNSHYAVRNIICENTLLKKFYKSSNEIQIIRLANIFGVVKNYKLNFNSSMFELAINQFCLKALKDETIVLHSNKKEKRNYVSINDFVYFLTECFINKKIKLPPVINYAAKKPISLSRVIKILRNEIKELYNKSLKIKFMNKVKNSKINYNFDVNDIEQRNLIPKLSIKAEIRNSLKKMYILK